ncbi:uncharacterized protein V1510DRAFT_413456 [Dipodascopsis tothii]|uniref:uncharacterized protein n=1 Tax=Dipodascopsis tothii TaxID=44089 RepID=UPI0034CF8A8A
MARTSSSRPPAVGGRARAADDRRRREATIYDAGAGRVGRWGRDDEPDAERAPTRGRKRAAALGADEVVSARKRLKDDADDVWDAIKTAYDRAESSAAHAPSSDLLQALHQYAADRADRALTRGLDETALVALGLVVEAAVRRYMAAPF